MDFLSLRGHDATTPHHGMEKGGSDPGRAGVAVGSGVLNRVPDIPE
jgi:hypothetical protein